MAGWLVLSGRDGRKVPVLGFGDGDGDEAVSKHDGWAR